MRIVRRSTPFDVYRARHQRLYHGSAAQFMGPGAALRGTAGARAFLRRLLAGMRFKAAFLVGCSLPRIHSSRWKTRELARSLGRACGDPKGYSRIEICAREDYPGHQWRSRPNQSRSHSKLPTRANTPCMRPVSDSIPAKTVASAGKYLPFSGSTKAARAQQDAFNRGAIKDFRGRCDQIDR